MGEAPAKIPAAYAALRQAVERAMIHGQREVEVAKVATYHETGRLICEHLFANRDRAAYGARTFGRLSADLKVDRSVLQRCARFYRAFPIWATWPNLAWAHYRALLPIEDARLRRSLAAEANRHGWSVAALEQRILAVVPPDEIETPPVGPAAELLVPQRGRPGLHMIVDRGDGPAVDLGFRLYQPLHGGVVGSARRSRARRLEVGAIVQLGADGRIARAAQATKAGLFTYDARLRRVVDGDTLVVALRVAPGIFLDQKLRLRGLDCPELATPEGRAAKRFVDVLAARTSAVTIRTAKPDKYDRYLADVFLKVTNENEPEPGEDEVFLNNALLENGHAVRKDAWEFADWGRE